jgi:hypothetical protein
MFAAVQDRPTFIVICLTNFAGSCFWRIQAGRAENEKKECRLPAPGRGGKGWKKKRCG